MPSMEEVWAAKELHKELLLSKPNVVGVGTAYKWVSGYVTPTLCVAALVRHKIPDTNLTTATRIPAQLGNFMTDVIEIGDPKALVDRKTRQRPAQPGLSIGHFGISAGTFGALVRDRRTGIPLILSNNHVLSNLNNAQAGDAIVQPGTSDGGQTGQDTLAHLVRFVPIRFVGETPSLPMSESLYRFYLALARALKLQRWIDELESYKKTTNMVDAAVARPLNASDISPDILEIGMVSGAAKPTLGMLVRKSGRTTGLTTGTITVTNATITVNYTGNKSARFENQLVTSPMSQGGDSGSLLMDAATSNAVGLLFAGSDQASIHTPIQVVLDALEINL